MPDKSRNLCKAVDEDARRYKCRGCTRMKPNGELKSNQYK